MATGVVTEFTPSKGYGFVRDGESGMYIRFDMQSLLEEISLHDRVSYTIVELYPGRVAVNIVKMKDAHLSELDHNTNGRQYSSGGVGDGT
ncbi:MAG: hypothetical protein IPM52_01985 [Bacteroidetes bacterium]|nr:hypothetical protein [Bacteroidota bacterium]